MIEMIEVRIPETSAKMHLAPHVGVTLGDNFVRKVVFNVLDPLFSKIHEIDRQYRMRDDVFVLSWNIRRKYNRGEIASARAFLLGTKHFLSVAGEAFGTQYDDSSSCTICGSAAPQIT